MKEHASKPDFVWLPEEDGISRDVRAHGKRRGRPSGILCLEGTTRTLMLTHKDVSQILDFIAFLKESEKGESIFVRLCRELQPLLGFSSAGFIPFDPKNKTVLTNGYLSFNCNSQVFLQYILHYSSEDPFLSTGWYKDDRSNVALLSHFISEENLLHSRFAKDFLSQVPMLYCMRIKIFSQGEFRGLLSLHRTSELGDYTEREISISEVLFPYLGLFLLPSTTLREQDPFSITDHGVILVTEHQQVLYSNEIGNRIFQEIREELLDLSGELLLKQNPIFLQTSKGPFRVRAFPLNLHFSLSLPEDIQNCRRRQDKERIRVLFLEPLTPAPFLPGKTGGLLSPKQLEVTRRVLQGCSNRRIAETLGITEQTVKDHLHAIFEKLRLKNRWELIVFFGGKPEGKSLEE